MKTAYILIDFENVQPDKVGALDGAFKIKVFVGAKQSRILLSMASALQALGSAVEYVQIEGSGRNALDLHIAYYIGRLSAEEPGAIFHVISKDTDYDPLIAHLKKLKISCTRWSKITDIAHTRAAATKAATKPLAKHAAKSAPPSSSRVDEVVDNLRKRVRARPASLKSLTSTIRSHYRGAAITDEEVDAIIEELKKRGLIAVKDGKVAYQVA